jgi:hypothetical protein
VRAGDVVWNPLTGEKALLVESGAETAGARVVADFAVESGGFVPGGEHVHDICAEHFDVVQGGSPSSSTGRRRRSRLGSS